MNLWHLCGELLVVSSLQNSFISATLECYWTWTVKGHATASQLGFSPDIWQGQFKTFGVFFKPFRGGFAGGLWIIVLLHDLNVLELEIIKWRPNILLEDFLVESRIHGSLNYGMLSRSWSSKAFRKHHITITTMFECWYDVHTFQKSSSFAFSVYRIFSHLPFKTGVSHLFRNFFGSQHGCWLLPAFLASFTLSDRFYLSDFWSNRSGSNQPWVWLL